MSVQLDNSQSVIDYCRSCPKDQLITSQHSNQVAKLPDCDMVVKFGSWVSIHEAENQQRAYELIDADIVVVPQVHQFFTDNDGWGYLVMDSFLQGKTIDPLSESHVQRLASILEYFSSITARTPGSLGGDPSVGLFWPETDYLTVNCIQQVEGWFNSRLFPEQGQGQVQFEPGPFRLCHLDIASRNVIWLDDGRICLLDWASAGFYPRVLELTSLYFQGYQFCEMLQNALGMTECEKEEQKKIQRALFNNEKYSFGPMDPMAKMLLHTPVWDLFRPPPPPRKL